SESICWRVSFLPVLGGGMTSSGSLLVMRSISLLFEGFPGTMARSPDLAGLKASSFRSKRSLALRSWPSGPWHLKQFSEKIGRISRLKSMAEAGAVLSAACVENASRSDSANNGVVIGFFRVISQPIRRAKSADVPVHGPFYRVRSFWKHFSCSRAVHDLTGL